MKNEIKGAAIRKARKKLQLTQHDLASKVGLSQSRISRLETGRDTPDQNEWAKLAACLNLWPAQVPPKLERPIPSQDWHKPKPAILVAGDRPTQVRENAARNHYGAVVDKLLRQVHSREDWRLCEDFLREAAPESGHEYFLWLRLLAAGGKPCWFSLFRAGFRASAVVESSSKIAIGDVRLACLRVDGPGISWLLYPQVTLDARKSYDRLDALASLRTAEKQLWVDLEVDGRGHDPEWDEQRQQHLDLPTLRLTPAELKAPDLLSLLEQKARELPPLRLAA